MGMSILFTPLHETWNERCQVSMADFREVFSRFGIAVGDLEDGTHSFDFSTPEGSAFTLHESASIMIENGGVAGLGIQRPCSPHSSELWLALLNIGLVMIPDNGPVFASPEMIHKISYLETMSANLGGVRMVERLGDFGQTDAFNRGIESTDAQ
jgi:hypothetical protein